MSTTCRSSSARGRRRSPTRPSCVPSASAEARRARGTLAGYKLTIRSGPRVDRESFDDLDEALAALEEEAKRIRSQGPLQARKLVREFEPGQQVAGRVEISTGGLIRRGIDAGIDVMGDGRYVAFRGGFGREEIDPGEGSPFAALRKVLRGK